MTFNPYTAGPDKLLGDRMSKADLDLVYIAIHREDEIRKYFLTVNQNNLLWLIAKRDKITANELSKIFDESIQNASTKLQTLYKKGYLNRKNIGDPTGGNMYEYSLADRILEVMKK